MQTFYALLRRVTFTHSSLRMSEVTFNNLQLICMVWILKGHCPLRLHAWADWIQLCADLMPVGWEAHRLRRLPNCLQNPRNMSGTLCHNPQRYIAACQELRCIELGLPECGSLCRKPWRMTWMMYASVDRVAIWRMSSPAFNTPQPPSPYTI